MTVVNHPFVASNVCHPINCQQSDYSVANEADLIIDKPLDADNEPITHHLPTQTIECRANEQYFECKLLKVLNIVRSGSLQGTHRK